jgi:hypothetical protein
MCPLSNDFSVNSRSARNQRVAGVSSDLDLGGYLRQYVPPLIRLLANFAHPAKAVNGKQNSRDGEWQNAG